YGAGAAQDVGYGVQGRIDMTYAQCMTSYGNTVQPMQAQAPNMPYYAGAYYPGPFYPYPYYYGAPAVRFGFGYGGYGYGGYRYGGGYRGGWGRHR
ncbi:MAG: hypothetical protein JWR10_4009, partial [Rubritepida sp.]|nr:hypothetical protein [Rubritepida sp.]